MAGENATLAPAALWKPQFFRILLPGFHTRLSIPRPFYGYVTKDNCTSVTLVSPLGNSWQVEVCGDDNHLCFGEGWEEFCQAHDLYVGCFLVFACEGKMVFRVTVFDSSSCMKEYNPMMEETDLANETREECSTPDEVRLAESLELDSDSHEEQAAETTQSMLSQERRALNNMGSSTGGSFTIAIRSHGLLKPNLHIPKSFQESSGISSINKVILRDPKMRLWPTTVYHRRRPRSLHSRFGYGWSKFCNINRVEEGDVCIFQTLPEEEKFTIHVTILKKHAGQQAHDLKPCQGELSPHQKETH